MSADATIQPNSMKHYFRALRGRIYLFLRWMLLVPPTDEPSQPCQISRSAILLRFGVAALLGVLVIVSVDWLLKELFGLTQGFVDGITGVPKGTATLGHLNEDFFFGAALGITITLVMKVQSSVLKSALAQAQNRLLVERETAARQQAESTLRLLKAQIEPHFLFNTLGAVQQLAEGQAPAAAALTGDLIAFLRSTLGSLRADTTTLSDDLAVCDAYLRIMQTRLTHRLTYTISCAPSLSSFTLPTNILLTLVENAVKHGIERALSGGEIRVTAARVGDQAVVTVADTGKGFGDTVGQGLGLQNIRDQIALFYAGKASLTLEENEPTGVIAYLSLPISE